MKKLSFLSLLFLAISITSLLGQKVRYIHQIFDSVNVTNTYYGQNITVLASPSFLKVPLPVSIYTPKGDTVSNRPLIIYIHTGNFLPFPVNQGTSGRTTPPPAGDPAASIAQLGMGFPSDSPLVEICTRLTKMGYVVAAIDYRGGWNPIASTQTERVNTLINAAYRGVQDLRTAIRFFKLTAKLQNNPFGVDTSKIVAWGQGTGGYVSMAAATMDNYLDIVLKSNNKFIGPDINGDGQPDPYVIQSIHGDIYGTSLGRHPVSGDTLSLPNHVGYSSDFQLCVNMGGALADSQWIDGTDLPMIGFQEPRDPFAPYKEGIVNVPQGASAPLPVVVVQGTYLTIQKADKLGLNKKMRDLKLADIYTQNANKKNDGIEGLYPINGNPANPFDSDPWAWWDTTVMKQIAPANNANGLLTNPDMSATKARRYIDTIIGYFAPRAFAVLDLGTFVSTPDLLKAQEVGFQMMPNPMTHQSELQTNPDYKMKRLTIYDINGRAVREVKQINSNHYTLERNALPQGVYYLQVGFDKGVITKSILIQ